MGEPVPDDGGFEDSVGLLEAEEGGDVDLAGDEVAVDEGCGGVETLWERRRRRMDEDVGKSAPGKREMGGRNGRERRTFSW